MGSMVFGRLNLRGPNTKCEGTFIFNTDKSSSFFMQIHITPFHKINSTSNCQIALLCPQNSAPAISLGKIILTKFHAVNEKVQHALMRGANMDILFSSLVPNVFPSSS
jgi:hypothetical protein